MEEIPIKEIAIAVEAVAKVLPETLKHISEIVKTTSDNNVKLKLHVIETNIKMLQMKVNIAQLLIDQNKPLGEELVKDIFSMADLLAKMNYDILEIVGSTTRENNKTKLVDTFTGFIKNNPEILLSPVVGIPGTTIISGAKKIMKKIAKD